MKKRIKLTILIFLTPETHKMINSLSCKCLRIKIDKAKRKENGINLTAIPERLSKEYLK